MHPSRLSFLAARHAQTVKILKKEFSSKGYILELECGHQGHCVSHMMPGESWSCRQCGIDYVKTAPQYQKEF